MALLDPIVKICNKLNRSNWKELFAEHGLDVSKPTPALLEKELSRLLATISGTSTIKRLLPDSRAFRSMEIERLNRVFRPEGCCITSSHHRKYSSR